MDASPDSDDTTGDNRSGRRAKRGLLERHFLISARGSTVGREILAGLTTFVAMVYIVAVNPAVMAQAGMDSSDVAIATIVVSIAGSMATGLLANLPLGLAPSMGSNAFFAYVIVGQMGLSWQAGLAIMLGSGVIVLLLGVAGIRERLTQGIPDDMKIGLNAAFGFFLCRIAVSQIGLAAGPDARPDAGLILLLLAIPATFVLAARRTPGALIGSVLVTATIFELASGRGVANALAALLPVWPHWPRHTAFALDFGPLIAKPLVGLIALAFVTFNECVGLIATTVTVTRAAGQESAGGMRAAYVSDASATVLGGLLGTASVSPYIESVAGVEAGGRTGLTAIVASLGFIATLFFTPLFSSIPPVATTPALMTLGGLMAWRSIGELAAKDIVSVITSVTMAGIALVSGNLTDALALGMIVYLAARWHGGSISQPARLFCILFVAAWVVSKFAV
ncbi:NCS2 family permease [Bradyrhizobium guangxiense]|uniref:NCS2 family permease n=1 Tax=Bradyrhizobium guangxiense TaxID=1325115 RepID=UPI0010087C12|nr:NCS2 family permease [Bradyrhizobium guangxiense]